MSDFLLDFRPRAERTRAAERAGALLRFCEDTQVQLIERDAFSLVLTRVDGFELWGPYEHRSPEGDVLVALAGRIALDQRQWDAAGTIDGAGGLACKAIFDAYRQGGADKLGELNGNFFAFVHDERAGKCHLVTDRCGMYVAYWNTASEGAPVFASHPDVLASVSEEAQDWDMTSLAEFLMTGRLTFPHSYHRHIQGIAPASLLTLVRHEGRTTVESRRPYFQFDFKVDASATEDDVAEKLADALGKAVRRRTLPLFGRTGIGLSGGLDSRAILSATWPAEHVRAFCLFDEENLEYRLAKAIADACRVELIPFRRDFEYYGRFAELGVRISGGTGCIRSNHYLGVRTQLRDHGITNLLTGCYCDYVFKALALNTRERPLSRLQEFNRFDLEFYLPCYWFPTAHRRGVEERLRQLFPGDERGPLSDEAWLEVERKRTFPLAYEGDNAMRTIPQRVAPWYLPIVDNQIVDTYLQTPSRYKLNASVFVKMLARVCDDAVCRIPDANTGAPPNASAASHAFHRYLSAFQNRIVERVLPRMAIRGSWPNWQYYLHHSQVVSDLWHRKNSSARDILTQLLGWDPYGKSIQEYRGREAELFTRLWTLKLWLDQFR